LVIPSRIIWPASMMASASALIPPTRHLEAKSEPTAIPLSFDRGHLAIFHGARGFHRRSVVIQPRHRTAMPTTPASGTPISSRITPCPRWSSSVSD
jgi:hypothetical protein